MSFKVTHEVFVSKKIEIFETNNMGRGIHATAKISRGDILLISHAFHGTLEQVYFSVENNQELFDFLSPLSSTTSMTRLEMAKSKVKINCFRTKSGQTSIGKMISLFNHSCNPNCVVFEYRGFECVFAWKDIKIGEELFIMYNSTIGHQPFTSETYHMFKCECDVPLEFREQFYSNYENKVRKWMRGCIPIIESYQTTRTALNIFYCQSLLIHNMIIAPGDIIIERKQTNMSRDEQNLLILQIQRKLWDYMFKDILYFPEFSIICFTDVHGYNQLPKIPSSRFSKSSP